MRIVDMHCDTVSELLKRRREGVDMGLRSNNCHVDLERMRKSGYLLQNFALFVDKECGNPWEEVMAQLALLEEELAHNRDMVAPVRCYEDIAANERNGRMSAVITVEEGAVCGGSLEKLDLLYQKGVRMLTLTWNYPNELGYPNLKHDAGIIAWGKSSQLRESTLAGAAYERLCREADGLLKSYLNTPDTKNGLTPVGQEFVVHMEEIGMIPDVSHLSDAGFYDVLKVTKGPFAASHSNARAVCPCVRNLTDEMIRLLAERGGVMGLNFCADFLIQKPAGEPNPGTIADVAAHARHIVNVGGCECLGLGSDFDGIDTHGELVGAQSMELLWNTLEKVGFLPSQLDKIFGDNVLRLYKEAW